MTSTPVTIESISKRYGNETAAVDGVDLSIRTGEFFTLLGPSGCGKTTLLRMIAGFLKPTAGTIRFGERRIDDVPAHKRNIGMVFQSYAIFPHLTVFDNIAYGLRVRGMEKHDITAKVERMIEMTRLDGLRSRRPRELSGGQQQRVVLARAMVIEPDVLLMDEPLSNLDTAMRIHLRAEIRSIQRQAGVTTIYVTHDQEEALLLSDRIAVMRAGRVEQVGAPAEIFNHPRTRYVASFIGESNFVSARVLGSDRQGVGVEAVGGWRFSLPTAQDFRAGDDVLLSFRPHDVVIGRTADEAGFEAPLSDVQFTGAMARLVFELAAGATVQATMPCIAGARLPALGERLRFNVPAKAIRLFKANET